MIYFIESQCSEGFIKIGFARDLLERLDKLQTSSAYDLSVVRVLPGGRDKEQELHARFASARMRGEWFRPTPELIDFIVLSEPECLGGWPDPEPPTDEQHEARLRRASADRHRADARWHKIRTATPQPVRGSAEGGTSDGQLLDAEL